MSLNLAILGCNLKEGDTVITSKTEHNSVLRPLYLFEDRGVKVRFINIDEKGNPDKNEYMALLEQGVKLVVINHISNVTGKLNNVAPIFEMAKQKGAITLLDAAQSIGHIDVHPEKLNADMLAFSAHKGLHSAPGTGILYVREGFLPSQIITGGTGIRSSLLHHPEDMPVRLEAGTENTVSLAALVEAVKWHQTNKDEIRLAEKESTESIYNNLIRFRNVLVYNDVIPDAPVISFNIKGKRCEDTAWELNNVFGIVVRSGLHCAPLIHEVIGSSLDGTVRVSPSYFTKKEEIEYFIDSVKRLAE
jgi:selenocysteine lyase/cysteine desulfurase